MSKPTTTATKYGTSTSRPCRKAGCGIFTSSEYCSRHTPKAVKAVAPETETEQAEPADRIEYSDVMPDRWPIQ